MAIERKRAGTAVRKDPTMNTSIPNWLRLLLNARPKKPKPKLCRPLATTRVAAMATTMAAGTSAGTYGTSRQIRRLQPTGGRGRAAEEEGEGRGSRSPVTPGTGVELTEVPTHPRGASRRYAGELLQVVAGDFGRQGDEVHRVDPDRGVSARRPVPSREGPLEELDRGGEVGARHDGPGRGGLDQRVLEVRVRVRRRIGAAGVGSAAPVQEVDRARGASAEDQADRQLVGGELEVSETQVGVIRDVPGARQDVVRGRDASGRREGVVVPQGRVVDVGLRVRAALVADPDVSDRVHRRTEGA